MNEWMKKVPKSGINISYGVFSSRDLWMLQRGADPSRMNLKDAIAR
jgi:hypothetical protein